MKILKIAIGYCNIIIITCIKWLSDFKIKVKWLERAFSRFLHHMMIITKYRDQEQVSWTHNANLMCGLIIFNVRKNLIIIEMWSLCFHFSINWVENYFRTFQIIYLHVGSYITCKKRYMYNVVQKPLLLFCLT